MIVVSLSLSTSRRFCHSLSLNEFVAEPLLDVQKKPKKRSIAGIDHDELVDPSKLADSDSCFLEFKGVQIHHKISLTFIDLLASDKAILIGYVIALLFLTSFVVCSCDLKMFRLY